MAAVVLASASSALLRFLIIAATPTPEPDTTATVATPATIFCTTVIAAIFVARPAPVVVLAVTAVPVAAAVPAVPAAAAAPEPEVVRAARIFGEAGPWIKPFATVSEALRIAQRTTPMGATL